MNPRPAHRLSFVTDPWPESFIAELRRDFPTVWARRPDLVRQTLNEAVALATQSGVPHLVAPTLALEKLEALARWDRRQQALWRQSSARLVAA